MAGVNRATRDAYGSALQKLKENQRVVVLEADLGGATRSLKFRDVCPQRYFDMGISEADMMGTAAGLATCGKIPFASTFAVFAAGRAFEQIRNSIAYPHLNVKIVGTHAGVSVGPDGGTHQAIEDMALMRSLPGMVVLCPADDVEAEAAVLAAAEYEGPVYLRLGRSPVPRFHDPDMKFTIGKGEQLRDGEDVTLFSTGLMTSRAIVAADALRDEGIRVRVIHLGTIKPLDEEIVLKAAHETKHLVTVEEHNVIGGLGSAVSELLTQAYPARLTRIGVQDRFGQSGPSEAVLSHYGLDTGHIEATVRTICVGN